MTTPNASRLPLAGPIKATPEDDEDDDGPEEGMQLEMFE